MLRHVGGLTPRRALSDWRFGTRLIVVAEKNTLSGGRPVYMVDWPKDGRLGARLNASELKPGIIVRGPVLPESIEVLVITPLGDVIKIVGAGQKTGQVHQRVLRPDQLALLEATPEREPFDGDPARFRLGIEAARLGLAYEYDPYFSLSISRVDPLPHQLGGGLRLLHAPPAHSLPAC